KRNARLVAAAPGQSDLRQEAVGLEVDLKPGRQSDFGPHGDAGTGGAEVAHDAVAQKVIVKIGNAGRPQTGAAPRGVATFVAVCSRSRHRRPTPCCARDRTTVSGAACVKLSRLYADRHSFGQACASKIRGD